MEKLGKKPPAWMVYGGLVTVQVLFGLNYVFTKVVVDAFHPMVWASFRIVVAAAFMMTVALASGRPHPRDGRKFFLPLIVFAAFGMIINQGSFLVGLHYTTATNSAILCTLIPIITLLIVTLRGQEPLTARRIVGFIFAFSGVLVIRHIENISLSDKTLFGDSLMLVNATSFAIFLSFSKHFMERHDRVWTTAWLFVYGTVGLTLLAAPEWAHFQMPPLSPTLIGCMIFAVLGGTIATYFLNVWTLAHARSSSVALFIYIQPVVAALLAWVWFGEVITLRTALSSILIFVGVILALVT